MGEELLPPGLEVAGRDVARQRAEAVRIDDPDLLSADSPRARARLAVGANNAIDVLRRLGLCAPHPRSAP